MTNFYDVATIGTSLTAGGDTGAGVLEPYHLQLAPALQAGKASRIRTYNFGLGGGYTDPNGLAAYPIAARLRPRVILIEFSMNDVLKSTSQARTDMRTLLSGLQAASPTSKLFLMTMNPVVGSSPSAVARAAVNTYYQIYRDEIALQPTVGLIDVYPSWSGATLTDIPDGVHPTSIAQKAKLIPAILAALGPEVT